jgi:hypothetical protein
VKGLAWWRIAAAIVVLAGLAFILAAFAPIYFGNLQLRSYVSDLTQTVETQQISDDLIRTRIAAKAHDLNLPVGEENVHVLHAPGRTDVQVRYSVRVNLPGYTVDLHFNPGATAR